MSVYSIIAATTGHTQMPSGYGPRQWWTQNAQYIATYLGPSDGGYWAIWAVKIPGAIPGEALNQVRLRGGHDYTVGPGGLDKTRLAEALVRIEHSPAAFNGQVSTISLGGVVGSGVGANIDATVTVSGFTSDDLIAGNVFLGVAVHSSGGDPGFPAPDQSVYRWDARTWDFFTGASTPTPPVGTPTLTITGGAGNASPGVYAGTPFNPTVGLYGGISGIQRSLDFQWDIVGPPGITFASNGAQSWRDTRGSDTVPPPDEHKSTTPVLNVTRATPAGVYTLRCTVHNALNPVPDVTASTQLTVIQSSYIITEV